MIEDSLRQDRRESQCEVYFFIIFGCLKHLLLALTPWQDHGEYRSLSIYMYPMIIWKFLRKAWHVNAVAGRGFY